ncbi:LuxR family transcriptional regulator [Streptomyces griseoluteus]|uniref:LuxR family transcriptional regulator n=1 Tax=Streptomyces griseoluteus TaxID=29306 RepID=UPI00380B95C8
METAQRKSGTEMTGTPLDEHGTGPLQEAIAACSAGPAEEVPDYRTTMRNVAEALSGLSRAVAEQADWAPPEPRSAPHTRPVSRETGSVNSAFQYLNGLPDINRAIQNELAGAREEILTAQPDGSRPPSVLRDALASVRRQLAAGVAMRTLYQHSTRFDEPTKHYVKAVTEFGVQVRTLPEFFERLIIIDRSAAFIPGSRDRQTAVLVREPAVVGFLTDVFTRQWDRAEPFPFVPVRAAEAAGEVIPDMRESIRKLLIEGRSDKEIARRLGLSLRSLQSHVARLKEDYGAQHRLQLGYLMALSDHYPAGPGSGNSPRPRPIPGETRP